MINFFSKSVSTYQKTQLIKDTQRLTDGMVEHGSAWYLVLGKLRQRYIMKKRSDTEEENNTIPSASEDSIPVWY